MSASKVCQRLASLIIGIMLLGTAVCTTRQSAPGMMLDDEGSQLVGNWTGESICVGNNPACHDERVVYRISKPPDKTGKVTITADKIINGKPETMGVLDFKYDKEKGTLVNEFQTAGYHGVWELTVKDDVMEGTLILLPDKTIARRVRVKKDK